MTKLSVNINKIATLRNARGGNMPDVIKTALDCEQYGAEGITVHPRPDGRHIRYQDVYDLKKVLSTEFNIEGYPSESFISLVTDVVPAQVTLVPDPPDALTSNSGWNVQKELYFLKDVISIFKLKGIRTSIFLDPLKDQVKYAAETGADRIELYTEAYATHYNSNREKAIRGYKETATQAQLYGLGVNAGHDLSLENLAYMVTEVNLLEVSIGHALICDALYYGLENTIQMYLNEISKHKSLRI